MNLFEQIINQSKLGTPGQFSGGTSFGSINTQDFQSKAPTIQKSLQAEQNLRNQGFSDKEVKFLKLQKEKGVDMNQAFAFVEQKRKEEAQIKNAPTNFDMTGGAVSQVPKALGETASWMSSMGANTPMAMASAAIRAPFSEKTYGQLREEQKNAGQVFADIGQKGKEAIQSTGLYNPNSTGAKIGETITDIGSTFVGPNKIKILKEGTGLITKYLPKVLSLAQEGAVMGAKYDIATKGEVTKEGAGYGALGNLVFGGVFGATKRGYDIVKNQLPASLTLGGLINPGKLDIVKKSLQVDEGVATPQDVGKWILDRVKPGNKQEIAEQLIQHAEKTKGAVDEALASIPTYFKNPEAKKALLQIRSELEGKAGLEGKLSKIDELLAKPDYTLSELNAVKRELDDMYNLYTKTGDPSAGLKAEGLRNIRANLRGFIEKEAEKYGVNIRKLNNETSVARGLADGMLRKDSADGVRELLTAFAPSGAGAAIGAGQAIVRGEDPLTVLRDALIGGIATKIGTSTEVRTRIASALNRLAPKDLTALENYIRSGGKDAIGKKVAEKVIKEGRALPARTLTKETDFIKPTPKAIVTPQTQERAIINQSKKGVSSNVKRPVTPQKKEAQKLLPAPRIPAGTSIPRTDVSAESMRGLSSNVKRPNGNTNNTSSNPRSIPVGSKEVQEPSTKTKKIEDSDFPDDPPPPPPSEGTPVVKPSVKPPKKVVAPKKPNPPTNEQQVSKPISGDTIPEGYTKNMFGEVIKKPSNSKGGFIRIPFTSKSPKPQPKRLFAGENSAQPPSKKTGWFKGADGKMRFEIDDSNSVILSKENGKLGDILDHSELYKQYPELKNLEVKFIDDNINNGFYDIENKKIYISNALKSNDLSGNQYKQMAQSLRNFLRDNPEGNIYNSKEYTLQRIKDYENIAKAKNPTEFQKEVKSTLLHEIQHAIQEKEGFAKGGNTDGVLGIIRSKIYSLEKEMEKLGGKGYGTPEYNKIRSKYNSYIDIEKEAKYSPQKAFELYKSLAGEVESRNVQSRMGLSAKERTIKKPKSTEDVPRAKQIIRMDSKGPSMSVKSSPKPIVKSVGDMETKKLIEPIKGVNFTRLKGLIEDIKSNNGGQKGVLGDFLEGNEMKKIYGDALDTPVYIFDESHPVFKTAENINKEGTPRAMTAFIEGGKLSDKGTPIIAIRGKISIDGLIKTLTEEGIHALQKLKGRKRIGSATAKSFNEYEKNANEVSAKKGGEYAMKIINRK